MHKNNCIYYYIFEDLKGNYIKMRMKLMYRLVSIVMVLFVLGSCGEDETVSGQSIVVSIDGSEQTYTFNGAYLSHQAINVSNYDTTRGSTMAIQLIGGSNVVNLVYVFEDQNWNTPCVEEGNYKGESFAYGDMREFLCTGSINGGFVFSQSTSSVLGTISKCNSSNKKISGTFDFVGEDDENSINYNISGSFTDLSFSEI